MNVLTERMWTTVKLQIGLVFGASNVAAGVVEILELVPLEHRRRAIEKLLGLFRSAMVRDDAPPASTSRPRSCTCKHHEGDA